MTHCRPSRWRGIVITATLATLTALCAACSLAPAPTPTPLPTATLTPTPSATLTPTSSATPTSTATATPIPPAATSVPSTATPALVCPTLQITGDSVQYDGKSITIKDYTPGNAATDLLVTLTGGNPAAKTINITRGGVLESYALTPAGIKLHSLLPDEASSGKLGISTDTNCSFDLQVIYAPKPKPTATTAPTRQIVLQVFKDWNLDGVMNTSCGPEDGCAKEEALATTLSIDGKAYQTDSQDKLTASLTDGQHSVLVSQAGGYNWIIFSKASNQSASSPFNITVNGNTTLYVALANGRLGFMFQPGASVHRDNGVSDTHSGTDYGASEGTPVLAPQSGTVTYARADSSGALAVAISHGYGLETSSVHLSKILVPKGLNVGAGDIIGLVGQTGTANYPHDHFDVRTPEKPNYYFSFTSPTVNPYSNPSSGQPGDEKCLWSHRDDGCFPQYIGPGL